MDATEDETKSAFESETDLNLTESIDELLGLNDYDMLEEYEKHKKKYIDTNVSDYKHEKKEEYSNDKNKVKFPVQVFVRLRPLIKEEIKDNHKEIEYDTKYRKKSKSTTMQITDITARRKNIRKPIIPSKNKSSNASNKKLKSFKGFKYVLNADDNNFKCFSECVLPSIDNIFNGYSLCAFAYGHTGSGKTHTILGYDADTSPGMYRLTAKYICDKLEYLNKCITNKNDQVLLSCRFSELYQGKMRDLFGNLVECHVREDNKGNVNIRGPTIKDEETGEVKVQPLTPLHIGPGEVETLIDRVTESLKYRKQGSSGVHDESSRSHVFLEMELVTNKLIEARRALWNAEATLVPVGHVRDCLIVKIQGTRWENPDWKPDPEDRKQMEDLQKEFVRLDKIVKQRESMVEKVMNDSDECIGGTICFVDLAGNEWGKDSKNIKNNAVQMSERKEINKSLLSLKECVRALHNQKGYVPYRDSKLTMILRPHLKGMNSTAIMIANVSPSEAHIQKTYNTLLYSQLVAKA